MDIAAAAPHTSSLKDLPAPLPPPVSGEPPELSAYRKSPGSDDAFLRARRAPPDEAPPVDETPAMPGPAPAAAHRFGVAGKIVVDGQGRGAGGVVGAVIWFGPITIDLAAIVGPTFGAYGGVHLGFGRGRLRPIVGLGVPVFFDDGARIGARAAGGLEYHLSPRLRMSLEVGAEYMVTRADDIDRWLLAPAVAAEARL